MTLKLRSAAVSDRGLIRSANQDSVHAGEWLVVVADGMGGMAAGDLASAIAIEAIAPLDVALPDDRLAEALREAIGAASERIRAAVTDDPTREGMGTTLTALLCSATGTAVALVHLGDSRAYLLRGGVLEQMTKDDTFVQMLVDEGMITAEEAINHPRRAVVTRALQGEPVTAAYGAMPPVVGDRWMLCSDGLSNVVPAETMAEVLTTYPDRQACAQRLVDLALEGGGPDNVTVIVADIVEES
ncbi:protein phosphatase 2C domain-containing protein [Micromonospora sp. NPDC049679]|uniref:PP2C family protein-serine/threonine phosphatase n=1 Tax=Micromonospora sp. NPDC049679 TaxID=3155920 RepID=UPI0033F2B0D7